MPVSTSRARSLEILTACALVGLAVFPLVGNVLALWVPVPRRAAQAAALILFGAFALYGSISLFGSLPLWSRSTARRLMVGLLLGMALIGVPVAIGIRSGLRPSPYAITVASVSPLWLAVVVASLLDRRKMSRRLGPFVLSERFNRFVLALLAAAALTAYVKGPDRGEVQMAFGGSTTLAGMSAAMLGGVALAAAQRWYKVVSLLLALYLCFLATSRTGVLLFVAISAAVLAAPLIRGAGVRGAERLMRDGVLLIACTVVVVLPARFSAYYPYLTSRPGESGARFIEGVGKVPEWDAFVLRFGRIARLFRGGGKWTGLPPTEQPKAREAAVAALERAGSGDSRWVIIFDSLKAVARSPWGHWPRPFDQVVRLYCGRPPICAYPHNLILEIGYHFGWIPAGAVALGMAFWVVRALQALAHPALLLRVASVALLAHLAFAQVSGNLLDHSTALTLGLLWMAVRDGFGEERSGSPQSSRHLG